MKDWLGYYMPPDYSAHGPELDRLNANVHWLMLILFVGWGLVFLFMLTRFRASKHPKAIYPATKSHLSTYAEFGIWSWRSSSWCLSIPLWRAGPALPPRSEPAEVRVVAEQFAWNVHYPGADHIFGKPTSSWSAPPTRSASTSPIRTPRTTSPPSTSSISS